MISHNPINRPLTKEILTNILFTKNKGEPVNVSQRGTSLEDRRKSSKFDFLKDQLANFTTKYRLRSTRTPTRTADWTKFVLTWNRFLLTESTSINEEFLDILHRKGLLSNFYYSRYVKLLSEPTKLDDIFKNPVHRDDYYSLLMDALRETGNATAVAILEKEYQKMEFFKSAEASLVNHNFSSIAQAIGHNCDVLLLQQLYEADKSLLFQTGHQGHNLLHMAAECGHIDAVHYLISIGLDFNRVMYTGYSPFHRLGWYGGDAVEVTQALLHNGADLFEKRSDSRNAAHTACFRLPPDEYYKWLQFMINSQYKLMLHETDSHNQSLLQFTVRRCEVSEKTLQLFASELNLDFNAKIKDGITVLMQAAVRGQCRSILECIVSLGGDWTQTAEDGKNVLHYAVEGGNIDAVEYFLDLGVDPNATDNDMHTPLHCLHKAHMNYVQITELFIKHKGDLFSKAKFGNTVAHLFGRESNLINEYFRWKEYLKGVGYEALFEVSNSYGKLPY